MPNTSPPALTAEPLTKITAVILARNEADNIVPCIGCIGPHVQQIILIDMESEDQTVELARPLVSKIISHPLIPNFDVARNVAIPEALYDWLWFVDADERVSEATGRLVQETIRQYGDQFVALTIPFKTYFCGQWIQHCGWWPGYTMPRVLKRGHFRFGEELHSGVQFDGPELRVAPREDLAVDHFSYLSVQHYIEKLNRYTTGEAISRSAQGATPDWRRGVREMARDLWLYYERNQGSLDGYRGWILSWLAGQYRWLIEAKLLDLPEQGAALAQAAVPQNLDEVFALVQDELIRLRSLSPQLPLAVQIRTPFFDPSFEAQDGRTILQALALLERPSGAIELPSNDTSALLSPTATGLVRSMARQRFQGPWITLTQCGETLADPDEKACLNILRMACEPDRFPAGWLERLPQYDEIWVSSERSQMLLRRIGLAPERIRVLPVGMDTEIFNPAGSKLELPSPLPGRFVFLAVLDWQFSKGWDALLRAYCREFTTKENAGLLLKITRQPGHSQERLFTQANQVLAEMDESLDARPDIVLFETYPDGAEPGALYRSVQGFVLPSRDKEWGHAVWEAMACGVPTIVTRRSSAAPRVTEDHSFLVDSVERPVPEYALREVPHNLAPSWQEPHERSLRDALRSLFANPELAAAKSSRALEMVSGHFSVPALTRILEERLSQAESRWAQGSVPPIRPDQIRIELDGELFAGHSFSNINEQLARRWKQEERIAFSIRRRKFNPTPEEQMPGAAELIPWIGRELPGGAQVTIRHSFPPVWEPPTSGKWVHIQPWEFGYLPQDWIAPLCEQVDEIWAPSGYVRDVYLRSGIPADKIQVIPWGIDPAVYSPSAPARILPTPKQFKFLYVGGTISRKGFDLVLTAYLAEFQRQEDVCLVIKDLGTKTFYRYGNYREQIFAALADPKAPEIVYLDADLTEGQRASLYTACQCFVAPYRGEGFGLPILEAMACGLPPIIPRGGPTDDFAGEETAFLLTSQTVACAHDWKLCGEPTELVIDLADLRRAMRQAYADQLATRCKGAKASEHAHANFTWEQAIGRMTDRIKALAGSTSVPDNLSFPGEPPPPSLLKKQDLSVCLLLRGGENTLADCLSRIAPFAKELIVGDLGTRDRSVRIAQEYGATVLDLAQVDPLAAQAQILEQATQPWILAWETHQFFTDADLEHVLQQMSAAADAPAIGQPRVRLMRNSRPCVCPPFSDRQPTAELPIPVPASPPAASRASPISGDVPVPQGRRTRDPQAWFERGIQHFAQGNYYHAECYFTESLAQVAAGSPLHRNVLTGLIAVHHKTGDPFRAADFTEDYRRIYVSAPPPLVGNDDGSAGKETRLYLGAGQKRLAGYLHVDYVPGTGIDVAHNLDQRPWPWKDSSVSQIVAEDLVEHLSINLIEFCNEAWRVLRPGGELFIRTPHYQGECSWIDPTHRWHLHDQSFQYVDPETHWGETYPHYTHFKWEILSLGVRGPQHIHALLTPRKTATYAPHGH